MNTTIIKADTPVAPLADSLVGLVSKNSLLPLQAVSIKANLLDLVGKVTIFQKYINPQILLLRPNM